ncbi:MAG: D-alanyl-D-alanine carboxypeptidase [Micromonosporaceae bacterium]|nr:D-alanyl-D-alanine carboxypeptidase [Micromonosporaceae bacterium]
MNVRRLTTWLTRVGLAVGIVAVPAGPVVAGAPAYVKCPVAKIERANRPARPKPPAHEQSTVGGEALATKGLIVPDGAPPVPGNKLSATSWLVADLDTGEVLGACGPHEYGTPASVQKLLLAATMMPKLDPKQVVTVTRADMNFEPGSSAVGLVVGGKYPVSTLWLGLLLQSGNDAANVLARLGGGPAGQKGGVAAMNAEARRLGAFETHAVTPSGLDGPGQFTSAYDLALIARACFAIPDFRKYTKTMTAQIPAQPGRAKGFQIQNENTLLTRYKGALGGKTGYTDLARHTYVGAAERNGRRLVVTLLGAEARPLRGWQQGAALLDWGFSVPPGKSVGHLVTPEEVAQAATPTPTGAAGGEPLQARQEPAGASSDTPQAWSSMMVGGMAAVFALPVVLLIISTARRRRRAALRRLHQRE